MKARVSPREQSKNSESPERHPNHMKAEWLTRGCQLQNLNFGKAAAPNWYPQQPSQQIRNVGNQTNELIPNCTFRGVPP